MASSLPSRRRRARLRRASPEAGDVQPCLREGRLRPRHGRDPARRGGARHHRPRRSTRCATSSTAARSARMRAPATAPASSRRCPTPSSAPSSTSSCRRSGEYAVGMVFLPRDDERRAAEKAGIEQIAASENLVRARLARGADRRGEPRQARLRRRARSFEQLFVSRPAVGDAPALVGHRARPPRLPPAQARRAPSSAPTSSRCRRRTLVYKGMVTTLQLEPFYPDLQDERFASELALVHSRYSTNTFPSWPLAQPLRMIAHNGEINTVQGNRNWMRARQSQLESELLGDIAPLLPICTPGASDSASFDEVVELLTLTGRSLPHAIMMMVPEAWENQTDIDPKLRAFYEYHSMQMEPWDGPAALIFTDGTLVGATLDRNGLRPGRWTETDRRPRRARQRDRRARLRARAHHAQGPPAPGPHVPRRHRRSGASSRTTRSRRELARPRAVAASGSTRDASAWPTCPSASTSCTRSPRSPVASAPSATPRRRCASSSRRWRRTAPSRSARWASDTPDRRAQRAPAPALRLLHAAVRAGDEPAARLDPRRGRHLARASARPRAQPARAGAPSTRAR